MFFRKKKPAHKKSHQRLQAKMTDIIADTSKLSRRIKAGGVMPEIQTESHECGPINIENTNNLFVDIDKDGAQIFQYYHYTEDMNSLDPDAQVHLMTFFGDILMLNAFLAPYSRKRLDEAARNFAAPLLDKITSYAFFFECFLDRHELATQMLTHTKSDQELIAAGNQQSIKIAVRGKRIQRKMFNADQLLVLAPHAGFALPLSLGKPIEDGQKFINGVYFGKEAAKQVRAYFAHAQADTIINRQSA